MSKKMEFVVDDEAAVMFTLALVLTKENREEVFDRFARSYAAEAVKFFSRRCITFQKEKMVAAARMPKVKYDAPPRDPDGISVNYKNVKIGEFANTVLRKMLEEGKASCEEVEQMQTADYCKRVFGLNFPLLKKAASAYAKRPLRYYLIPLRIYGDFYFLCSEWFENEMNNDRPFLDAWIDAALRNGQ